jgi:hypothetical protein
MFVEGAPGDEPEVPTVDGSAFCCPHCGVVATQSWFRLSYLAPTPEGKRARPSAAKLCLCDHCGEASYWLDYGVNGAEAWRLALPEVPSGPPPHPDMPADICADYEEARSIARVSPRGACAILRLALQKLMVHLGCAGGNLNADIKALVASGLPVEVQQALDAVRVVGNNAVHPGELDIRDDPDTTMALFGALNFIVRDTIARPKAIQDLYGKLPPTARQQIERRDPTA